MLEYAALLGSIGVVLLFGAWRELGTGNRRDAGLLTVFAAGTTLAGSALWFG